ncbi:MAG TPA: NPCBM/NEW2 domain-containing protein [Planctomycetota bacterium]|nr:NPCBM/NEW2 domain-containing protein [Planctomycetota bacterium]
MAYSCARSGFRSAIALILLPLLAHAAEPRPLPVRAVTVTEEAIEGGLLAIHPAPAIELRVETGTRTVACADLLALELRQGKPVPSRTDAAVVLRNGDCLRGAIQGGSSRAVTVHSPVFGTAECPLQAVARIELPVPQPPRPLQAAEKLDRLLLRNNETIEGTLESLDAKGIKFRSALLGDLDVAFDRLAAVVFATQAGAPPKPSQGVVAIAHADDGTTLSGQLQGLKDGGVELQAAFGAALSLRLARLLSLEFRGGRLVYLSDLEPAEARETPFFDLVWHYRRDASVDGNPLRIGERTYRKGLGVHSRCELTYALGGTYARFQTDVGLDEEVGEKGNVDIEVRVDGKVKFERKALTGRDEPLAVTVDVAGAARLTLVVDFGADFDICDHLDWANARLIR